MWEFNLLFFVHNLTPNLSLVMRKNFFNYQETKILLFLSDISEVKRLEKFYERT